MLVLVVREDCFIRWTYHFSEPTLYAWFYSRTLSFLSWSYYKTHFKGFYFLLQNQKWIQLVWYQTETRGFPVREDMVAKQRNSTQRYELVRNVPLLSCIQKSIWHTSALIENKVSLVVLSALKDKCPQHFISYILYTLSTKYI